ncbi:MaoC family dehydratase [Chloroflexota bacterium]
MNQDLYEELQAMVGQEGPQVTGIYEVCKPMIMHWCEAMEDTNPLYTDEEYAKKSKYGNIIAPPTMVQTFTMPPLWPNGQELRHRYPEKMPKEEGPPPPSSVALSKLTEAGYVGVVATENVYEFYRPLFPGDKVNVQIKLGSVSPEKKTSRGIGHFVTQVRLYTNQKGELICEQSMTVLKFKSPEKEA